MKSKQFIQLLRKIIREEVQSAVREVMTEQVEAYQEPIMEEEIPMPRTTRRKKTYSNNSMLNDILNETAALPPDQELAEWSTHTFRSEMAKQFGEDRSQINVAPTVDNNNRPVDMQNEQVAAVVDAMNRDYSALMKAIDKKKGMTSG